MKSIISLIISFFFAYNLLAQCLKVGELPFKPGEKLTYTVQYNLGIVWFDAGEVVFRVDTINKKGKRFFHFISTGRSYKSYDWIFKVRDRYEVITFEKSLRPLFFHRKTDEGGYQVDNTYRFSYKNDKIYMRVSHSDSIPYKDTISPVKCLRDALSSAYFLRGVEVRTLRIGQKINLDMVLDGKKFDIYVKYLGKDLIKLNDTLKVQTLKFTTSTIEGSIFRGGENVYVWITDDKNKIPVKIEAYILVGKVIVYLRDYKGLKYPPQSFIYEIKRSKN